MGSSLLRVDFAWLRRAGATLSCCARTPHGGGFSCRAQALEPVGSVVVVHGLCCPKACGILVSGGIKTVSPALPGRFLTTGAPSCYLYDGDDRNCLAEDHQLSEKLVAQCLGPAESESVSCSVTYDSL